MQAGLPCLAQKRESEIGLRERFAAGDGQAAAGSGIEHVILFHPFHDVGNAALFPVI